ncbi:uncharacterized protein mdu isoform X3 [Periplaneta americana]|uniref:uncharacterized protein mdu isoform X3 n=1 Tax=Periplaneta americana TaxID=6978 RepID=UPI0037E784D3
MSVIKKQFTWKFGYPRFQKKLRLNYEKEEGELSKPGEEFAWDESDSCSSLVVTTAASEGVCWDFSDPSIDRRPASLNPPTPALEVEPEAIYSNLVALAQEPIYANQRPVNEDDDHVYENTHCDEPLYENCAVSVSEEEKEPIYEPVSCQSPVNLFLGLLQSDSQTISPDPNIYEVPPGAILNTGVVVSEYPDTRDLKPPEGFQDYENVCWDQQRDLEEELFSLPVEVIYSTVVKPKRKKYRPSITNIMLHEEKNLSCTSVDVDVNENKCDTSSRIEESSNAASPVKPNDVATENKIEENPALKADKSSDYKADETSSAVESTHSNEGIVVQSGIIQNDSTNDDSVALSENNLNETETKENVALEADKLNVTEINNSVDPTEGNSNDAKIDDSVPSTEHKTDNAENNEIASSSADNLDETKNDNSVSPSEEKYLSDIPIYDSVPLMVDSINDIKIDSPVSTGEGKIDVNIPSCEENIIDACISASEGQPVNIIPDVSITISEINSVETDVDQCVSMNVNVVSVSCASRDNEVPLESSCIISDKGTATDKKVSFSEISDDDSNKVLCDENVKNNVGVESSIDFLESADESLQCAPSNLKIADAEDEVECKKEEVECEKASVIEISEDGTWETKTLPPTEVGQAKQEAQNESTEEPEFLCAVDRSAETVRMTYGSQYYVNCPVASVKPMKHENPISVLDEKPMKHENAISVLDEKPMKYENAITVLDEKPMKHENAITVLDEKPMKHENPISVLDEKPMKHENAITILDEKPMKHENAITVLDEETTRNIGAQIMKKYEEERQKLRENLPDVSLLDVDASLEDIQRERRRIIENQTVRAKRIDSWIKNGEHQGTVPEDLLELDNVGMPSAPIPEFVVTVETTIDTVTKISVPSIDTETCQPVTPPKQHAEGEVVYDSIIQNKHKTKSYWEQLMMAAATSEQPRVPYKRDLLSLGSDGEDGKPSSDVSEQEYYDARSQISLHSPAEPLDSLDQPFEMVNSGPKIVETVAKKLLEAETAKPNKTASEESVIQREIRLQREREEALARERGEALLRAAAAPPPAAPVPEQVTPNTSSLSPITPVNHSPNAAETKIALELREMREREEELRRLRQRLNNKDEPDDGFNSIPNTDEGNYSEYGSEEKELSLDGGNSRMMSPEVPAGPGAFLHQRTQSMDSMSSGHSSGSGSGSGNADVIVGRRRVTVKPLDEPEDDDVPSYMMRGRRSVSSTTETSVQRDVNRNQKETPIEREIRLAREREEELRREKRLPPLNSLSSPAAGKQEVTRFTDLAEFAIEEQDRKLHKSVSTSHIPQSVAETENAAQKATNNVVTPPARPTIARTLSQSPSIPVLSPRKFPNTMGQKGLMQRFLATRGKMGTLSSGFVTSPTSSSPAPIPAAPVAVNKVVDAPSIDERQNTQDGEERENGDVQKGVFRRGGYISAEEKIQVELQEMQKREEELRLQRARMFARSQPNLLCIGDDDEEENDASDRDMENHTPLRSALSNPNLLDSETTPNGDSDTSLDKPSLRNIRKRSALIAQWENMIQQNIEH